MPPPSEAHDKPFGPSKTATGRDSPRGPLKHFKLKTRRSLGVSQEAGVASVHGSSRAQSVVSAMAPAINRHEPSGLGLYIEQTRTQPFGVKLSAAAQYAVDQLPPTQSPPQATTSDPSQTHETIGNFAETRQENSNSNASKSHSLGLNIPQTSTAAVVNPDDLVQSATEYATPSIAGTPALRGADDALRHIKTGVEQLHEDAVRMYASPSPTRPILTNTAKTSKLDSERRASRHHESTQFDDSRRDRPQSVPTIEVLISTVASLRNVLAGAPNLGASLANLGQRVDALESASFAHSSVEDLNDKFELFDGRILDIESRIEELEKFRHSIIDPHDSMSATESFSRRPVSNESDMHYSREGRGRTDEGLVSLFNAEASRSDVTSRRSTIERLHDIECRLTGLARPLDATTAEPTTVEVILLPWGRELKGVWQDPKIVPQILSSVPPYSNNTQYSGDVSGNHDMEEWPHFSLVPRAIGPTTGIGGRVYERLKSRGFVRSVVFNTPSAREVTSRVCAAFKGLLDTQPHLTWSDRLEPEWSRSLLALKSPFIPLRKIHKHSRLRYLAEAELATPALWDVNFLESSIFMRAPSAGQTRLFVTTPSAYLHSPVPSWTWQKIRELPRVSPDTPASGVSEADAREPCWEHDPRLDPPSAHPSFTSNPSPKPTDPPSDEEFNAFSDSPSSTPFAPITPTSDFPRRATSFPVASAHLHEPPKRQVASFDALLREPPRPLSALSKRRRLSRTPEGRELDATDGEGDGQGSDVRPGRDLGGAQGPWSLTPRRSHEPRSPFEAHPEGKGAYATPYSYPGAVKEGDTDGDADADVSVSSEGSSGEEEEESMEMDGDDDDDDLSDG